MSELTLDEMIARGLAEIDGYIAGFRDTIVRNEKHVKTWEKKRKALESHDPDAVAQVLAGYPKWRRAK
jgi:hypothetical protein